MGTIAVTGATGAVGGRVAARLAARGAAQRLIVRDPARAPRLPDPEIAVASSYSDTAGMRSALTGIDTLFLVSGRESADRVQHHVSAIDAALSAGVGRIIYLSFLNAAPDATFTLARQHYQTEKYIRAAGVPFTFLRPSLYLDSVPAKLTGADGVMRGPADGGRAAWIARDDLADVATAVLLSDGHEGRTYNITGREALTLDECAAQLSAVTGRTVRFRDETIAEAWQSRAQYGAPEFEVEGWISSYLAIASGEMGPASDIVAQLTGHPAQTLREYLRDHPESYQYLLGL
ncbi:MAG TPA: SDR family oxidoreductase [Chloroflexota bacterium]|nr:SDR family oxidoreductase [Chloroflexota bacterium]